MTRRKIVFIDSTGSYETPEFNGDKKELERFGSADWCDKNWPEIEAEFLNVKTLDEFKAVSNRVQMYYHSSIAGQAVLPVIPVPEGSKFKTGTELQEIVENVLKEEY